VSVHLERRHQHPLLDSGLHGLRVSGELEVGEVVGVKVVVEVVVVEVHVLVLVAVGAGTLCPQLLAKLAPEALRGVRRVKDVLILQVGKYLEVTITMLPSPSFSMMAATSFSFPSPLTSQHAGQLRGRIGGFCAYHRKLWDFFVLLSLKPKRDRVSLRGGMVYSRRAKEFNMTSFDHLFVGKG
jgi:hypothetical protein